MFLADLYTVQASVSGVRLSLFHTEQIKRIAIGVQIMSKHFSEDKLLAFSKYLLGLKEQCLYENVWIAAVFTAFLVSPLTREPRKIADVSESYADFPDLSYDLIEDRLSCLESTVPLNFNSKVKSFIEYFAIRDRNYTKLLSKRKMNTSRFLKRLWLSTGYQMS